MFYVGRKITEFDRQFLREILVLVVAVLLVVFSGPYTTLTVLGLLAIYNAYALHLLGKSMKAFDGFVDDLTVARKPAIILAAPALLMYYMS